MLLAAESQFLFYLSLSVYTVPTGKNEVSLSMYRIYVLLVQWVDHTRTITKEEKTTFIVLLEHNKKQNFGKIVSKHANKLAENRQLEVYRWKPCEISTFRRAVPSNEIGLRWNCCCRTAQAARQTAELQWKNSVDTKSTDKKHWRSAV